jgi:hypothetical protein
MPQRWPSCRARITSFFALLIGTLRRNPNAARIIARASFPVSVPIVASSVLSVLFIYRPIVRLTRSQRNAPTLLIHAAGASPSMRKDKRGFDLISDATPGQMPS